MYQNVVGYEGSGVLDDDSSVLECVYLAVNKTSERLIAVKVDILCVHIHTCVCVLVCNVFSSVQQKSYNKIKRFFFCFLVVGLGIKGHFFTNGPTYNHLI